MGHTRSKSLTLRGWGEILSVFTLMCFIVLRDIIKRTKLTSVRQNWGEEILFFFSACLA